MFAHHQWFVGWFWQLAICSALLLTKPSRESLNKALGSVREIWLVKKKAHANTVKEIVGSFLIRIQAY